MQIPLLLLHGAIGASSELQLLAERLSMQHTVDVMDLPGHGTAPMPAGKFSMPMFAEAVLERIAQKGWKKVNVFGYSMGGYVAMYMARHYPQVVNSVITFGTKYHWDTETAAREVKMLEPETILVKVPKFAKTLEERHHAGDWKQLLPATAELLKEMGENNPLQPEDFSAITKRVLLMVGDRDKMVTLEETVKVSQEIPHAQMAVLPGTPHAFDKADAALLSYLIEKFLN